MHLNIYKFGGVVEKIVIHEVIMDGVSDIKDIVMKMSRWSSDSS